MEAAGKRYIAYGSRRDEITIWNLSDLHLMSRACAMDELRADVRRIRDDPYSFWLGGGDYVDFIGYRDKRFDPDSVAEDVTVSELGDLGRAGMERARDLLYPIRDKCLGLLLGNHEKSYQRRTEHESLHGWLCAELETRSLGYCALFDVVFVRDSGHDLPVLYVAPPWKDPNRCTTWRQRIFCHHGAGYAQTPGGKLNRLIRFMNYFDADIYFTGHVHDQVGKRIVRLGANAGCTKLVQRTKIGVVSGSYLKTYAQGVITYGEQRGYEPVSLGAAYVQVKPDAGEVRGEL